MRLDIVDVFAERPLAGNQLAVVHAPEHLDTERMQDIAREMNFSETTFVLGTPGPARATVRIFTPANELPFAGHPTLGTAWVLGRDNPEYTLDLPVGPVAVRFGADGVCWMAPPVPTDHGQLDPPLAAALAGLTVDDLHPDFPPRMLEIGPRFALVGVADPARLDRTTLSLGVRAELHEQGGPVDSLLVFCPGRDTDFEARMYFDVHGVREDPATGSANSAFAVYLRDVCGVAPGRYVVSQGDRMQRPSRLYLALAADHYEVGGRVQAVAEGSLVL